MPTFAITSSSSAAQQLLQVKITPRIQQSPQTQNAQAAQPPQQQQAQSAQPGQRIGSNINVTA